LVLRHYCSNVSDFGYVKSERVLSILLFFLGRHGEYPKEKEYHGEYTKEKEFHGEYPKEKEDNWEYPKEKGRKIESASL
jgi:hypothetical protein